MIRDVLHSTQPADITSAGESKWLCDTFVEYFTVRIRTIKSSIRSWLAGAGRVYDELYADQTHIGETFSALQPPSVDEVTKLINAMPAKSSPVDKISTSIIKSCVDVFASLIARLATLSFREGVFPANYKAASVTPLLKKKVLDRENPANFRPISNLHTVSKILERIFLSKIIEFIEQSPHYNRLQSHIGVVTQPKRRYYDY